jgi:hypothetical protein
LGSNRSETPSWNRKVSGNGSLVDARANGGALIQAPNSPNGGRGSIVEKDVEDEDEEEEFEEEEEEEEEEDEEEEEEEDDEEEGDE